MTDNIHGLTVGLDRDYRDDDVQFIIDAIRMIKGVSSVTAHVTEMSDHLARERVADVVRTRMYNAIRDVFENLRLHYPEKSEK